MMNDNDRDCANEDDTMSFEALESRMRTPYKDRSVKVIEDKENTPSNLSGIEPMNDTVASPLNTSVERKLVVENSVDFGCSKSELVIDVKENNEEKHTEDDNDEEVNTSLRMAVSNIDLTTEPEPAPTLALARSSSLDNVTGVESLSPLVASSDLVSVLDSLDTCQEHLDRFRAEQDKLVTMEQELLSRIRQRKTEFKSLWGVSPISIKTKRTVIKPLSPLKFNLDINEDDTAEDGNVVLVQNSEETPKADDRVGQTPIISPVRDQDPPQHLETEKRVRFNPSHNETRSMTPNPELEESLDLTPVSSHGRRNTRNKSRKSFDSLKCSLAFLKTPQTAARCQGPRQTPSAAPTPMALRRGKSQTFLHFTILT